MRALRAERFLRAIGCLGKRDKLVRVKSWWPSWADGCVEWPVMLVDRPGQRMTATPVWDRTRWRLLFRGLDE